MKDLINIKNVADLTINETYIDGGSSYYVAKCKSVNFEVINNGFNTYFQSAVFDIFSISGRFVETVNRTFLHPTLNN